MLFFYDQDNSINITYEELFDILSKKTQISQYIYCKKTVDVIISLLSAMINNKSIILLDGDFSEVELHNLGITKDDLHKYYYHENSCYVSDFGQLREKILENSKSVKVDVFTSGTTGKPKAFRHSVYALLRNIKVNDNHKNDVWGLAYNITHYAGLQVFLQAVMNGNSILNLFSGNSIHANKIISEYKCDCISATPTFFRNYILNELTPNYKIKNVTFGGEKFNNNLIPMIMQKFPNCKIRNVYASTEIGSLLSGSSESFQIPEKIKEYIRINNANHLLVHKELLGSDYETDNCWYDTNDIVEFNTDGTFKFLNRDSDFINIGGYKVNPMEVEEVILSVPNVLDVVVWGRDNSVLGKILVADIKIANGFEVKEIRDNIVSILKNNLQSFKVPRILNFVNDIQVNRSGKKVRV